MQEIDSLVQRGVSLNKGLYFHAGMSLSRGFDTEMGAG